VFYHCPLFTGLLIYTITIANVVVLFQAVLFLGTLPIFFSTNNHKFQQHLPVAAQPFCKGKEYRKSKTMALITDYYSMSPPNLVGVEQITTDNDLTFCIYVCGSRKHCSCNGENLTCKQRTTNHHCCRIKVVQ